QKGDRAAGIGNATVTVLDTSHRATTDSQGRFTFSPIPPGEYTWRVEPPGGRPVERRIKVPSENYDIEVEA
ncbi:carboxypeptidase regulatory-like domain-containing protein, partial [bacterium]